MERGGRYGGPHGGYQQGSGGNRDDRGDRGDKRAAKVRFRCSDGFCSHYCSVLHRCALINGLLSKQKFGFAHLNLAVFILQFVPGKIFIGALSPDTNTEGLRAYCGQWGELSDVHIMMGKNYGFVTFENPKDAQKFLETREHVINGRQVDAKAAVPREQGGSRLTKKMFVGGAIDITDSEFRDYFARYGRIEDASVLRKPDGSSRGYGFVTFEDEMSVEKCLVQEHFINGHILDCKRAMAKEHHGPPGGGHGGGRGGGGYPGMMQGGGNGGGGGGGGGPNPAMMGGGMPMMGMMGAPNMGMMFPMGMGAMNPMGAMMGGPMMGPGARGMGGGGGGDARGGPKQPEWTCQSCGNTNFAWRQYCNKCKSVRAGAMMNQGGGGGGMGRMGGGPGGMTPGAGMMMGPAGAAGMAAMGGMQMPMGMMGGMGPGMAGMGAMGQGLNMMGAGAGMGGMGGALMNAGMGAGGMGGMGMMPGMDGGMGQAGMGGAMMGGNGAMMGGGGGGGGGNTGGGQGGQGQGGQGMGGGQGGGYGRMGGRGNGGNQSRFRPY